MKMQVQTEVTKEIYEAAVGLGKFAVAAKKALADGWQLGDDLSPLMASAMGDLLPALQGIEGAEAEMQAEPAAAVNGIIQGLMPLIAEMVKKDEVAE